MSVQNTVYPSIAKSVFNIYCLTITYKNKFSSETSSQLFSRHHPLQLVPSLLESNNPLFSTYQNSGAIFNLKNFKIIVFLSVCPQEVSFESLSKTLKGSIQHFLRNFLQFSHYIQQILESQCLLENQIKHHFSAN